MRMQKHPPQPFIAQRLLLFAPAVFAIAGNGVSQRQRVYANLMRAAGKDLDLAQRGVLVARADCEARMRRLAVLFDDLDTTLTGCEPAAHERGIHIVGAAAEPADEQREIALAGQALAEGVLGPQQAGPGLG